MGPVVIENPSAQCVAQKYAQPCGRALRSGKDQAEIQPKHVVKWLSDSEL